MKISQKIPFLLQMTVNLKNSISKGEKLLAREMDPCVCVYECVCILIALQRIPTHIKVENSSVSTIQFQQTSFVAHTKD